MADNPPTRLSSHIRRLLSTLPVGSRPGLSRTNTMDSPKTTKIVRGSIGQGLRLPALSMWPAHCSTFGCLLMLLDYAFDR